MRVQLNAVSFGIIIETNKIRGNIKKFIKEKLRQYLKINIIRGLGPLHFSQVCRQGFYENIFPKYVGKDVMKTV